MPSLILDQHTIDRMKAVEVGVEVRDPQGNLIGFFHPVITPADVDQYECSVSEEEVLRRAREGGGRPLAEILVSTQLALHELMVDTGLQVVGGLLEQDRERLCGGPRHSRPDGRRAHRHGFDDGQLVLGGRKISVKKPRVRSIEGKEVSLSSWEALSAEDPLNSRMLEQMMLGVSTRRYEESLEDLPQTEDP